MKSTALGAENIIFISDAHEKFYYESKRQVFLRIFKSSDFPYNCN